MLKIVQKCTSSGATPTSFITLAPLSLYILVALTKILTFISQIHVKGSQRIRFRWWSGSQRAANEIWATEPRLRDLREESVVSSTHNAYAGWFTQTHTHMKESTEKHACLRSHSRTHTKGSEYGMQMDPHMHETCRDKCVNTHTDSHRRSEAEDHKALRWG